MNDMLSRIAFLLFALPALAESPPLEGQAYLPAQLEIEWKATTNQLPKRMWVYKVVPQTFSGAVVSNAMAIGSFQARHLVNARDKYLLQFQDSKSHVTRYLKIAPSAGWMTYYDGGAIALMADTIKGVPDREETEQLARDYLLELGIDGSQIALKRGYGADQRRSRFAKDGGEVDVQVEARGVSLVRQIDGISFCGGGTLGGFWIQFGNHGKVAGFDLVWRNLRPHELSSTAAPIEIIASIKNGKAVAPVPRLFTRDKKLTVTGITPYYLGAHWEVAQELVYPILMLNVVADVGGKKENFDLYCPIVGGTPELVAGTKKDARNENPTNSEALMHVDEPIR